MAVRAGDCRVDLQPRRVTVLLGRGCRRRRRPSLRTRQSAAVLPPVLLGAFTREQAAEVGVGLKALARLRKAGLAVSREGVLRLVEPVQPALVALAAIGPPVALCSISAAGHYGWSLPTEPDRIHVVVPPRRCPAVCTGVVVHRRTLGRPDLVTVGGVRVTAPVRTALDVAAIEPLTE